mmetsp:Transcript_16147/g.23752  ORF Transcript_16147/g.23752 Transcript_16147/m.23752 type:complete len:294 (+) Transcript_16147:113-994(+)|eukprot:CAMPEP_0194223894 /NCGR_PEP_ID=MMETSP0156-20130528/36181_1 /TAXON_ID=33649 /ORGANISM="Thalassionema nitzschioides, Strain L26-B" /LENGTH=293 /DNA_ID=CAMNT_0038955211 /DNA_START=99 /DNA_END=980 /DNA_ORIENTATION=+
MKFFSITLLSLISSARDVSSFTTVCHPGVCRANHNMYVGSSSALSMGKGLNKGRNKQAELAKKLELARQQREGTLEDGEIKLTNEQMKEKNDRLRFQEMLENTPTGANMNADDYQSESQLEEDISARRAGVDRKFEGDPAPSEPFEELVSIKTQNAIGTGGASRLIPWLRQNAGNKAAYVVVVSDPRPKSDELRTTIKNVLPSLAPSIKNNLIFINADSPAENRRWMKKNDLVDIELYSDEKMEWMQAYTALGQKRWSMTCFVLKDERVERIIRDMKGVLADDNISNAVKSLD